MPTINADEVNWLISQIQRSPAGSQLIAQVLQGRRGRPLDIRPSYDGGVFMSEGVICLPTNRTLMGLVPALTHELTHLREYDLDRNADAQLARNPNMSSDQFTSISITEEAKCKINESLVQLDVYGNRPTNDFMFNRFLNEHGGWEEPANRHDRRTPNDRALLAVRNWFYTDPRVVTSTDGKSYPQFYTDRYWEIKGAGVPLTIPQSIAPVFEHSSAYQVTERPFQYTNGSHNVPDLNPSSPPPPYDSWLVNSSDGPSVEVGNLAQTLLAQNPEAARRILGYGQGADSSEDEADSSEDEAQDYQSSNRTFSILPPIPTGPGAHLLPPPRRRWDTHSLNFPPSAPSGPQQDYMHPSSFRNSQGRNRMGRASGN